MDTESFEGNWTWGRSAIMVKSVSLVTGHICEALNKHSSTLNYTDTLSGYITRNRRPAPDISMDYQIILDNPIQSYEDPSQFLSRMAIYPNISLDKLNEIISKKIHCTAYGRMVGGYAENIVFETDSIILR